MQVVIGAKLSEDEESGRLSIFIPNEAFETHLPQRRGHMEHVIAHVFTADRGVSRLKNAM